MFVHLYSYIIIMAATGVHRSAFLKKLNTLVLSLFTPEQVKGLQLKSTIP